MTDTTVSIIVPVYNVERYLPNCLDSIRAQTYPNIEVVLVDDGSTDGSSKICDDASNDYGFTVVHKMNGGLSDARNVGLDAANGDWIFFLDSDDYISPYCIETLLRVAHESKAEIVECELLKVDENDPVVWRRPQGAFSFYDQPEALRRFLDYSGTWIVACNKLYNARLFEGMRFPLGRLNEDEFTVPYVVERASRYASVPEALYAYTQREGSITHSGFSPKKLDGLIALADRLDHFMKLNDGTINAINSYHLLANCGSLKREYGEVLNRSQLELIHKYVDRARRIKVMPSYGIGLFLKSILIRLFPSFFLGLRKRLIG